MPAASQAGLARNGYAEAEHRPEILGRNGAERPAPAYCITDIHIPFCASKCSFCGLVTPSNWGTTLTAISQLYDALLDRKCAVNGQGNLSRRPVFHRTLRGGTPLSWGRQASVPGAEMSVSISTPLRTEWRWETAVDSTLAHSRSWTPGFTPAAPGLQSWIPIRR